MKSNQKTLFLEWKGVFFIWGDAITHLPAGPVILNEVKNGRSANYKEGPFMCRLRANFGRLAYSLQNARRTSSK